MADNFRFELSFAGETDSVAFQEASGLDFPTETQGKNKAENLTLKRGLSSKDNTFWKWVQDAVTNGRIDVKSLTIKLQDENDHVLKQWQLSNAYPVKIMSTELSIDGKESNLGSEGNEVAIESVDIAFETMIISSQ